jgi:hypothetical protein
MLLASCSPAPCAHYCGVAAASPTLWQRHTLRCAGRACPALLLSVTQRPSTCLPAATCPAHACLQPRAAQPSHAPDTQPLPARAPQALGTPCEASWPGCRDLPNFLSFEARVAKPLRQHFPRASEDALDLLGALLQLDPSKRPTGGELGGSAGGAGGALMTLVLKLGHNLSSSSSRIMYRV